MHPAYESKRRFFDAGQTRSYRFRVAQLEALRRALARHEHKLIEALRQDLDKPLFESITSELGVVRQEIAHTLEHLDEWMQPERKPTPFVLWPSRSSVTLRPLGVVLIVAPWNYPVQLLLMPLVGAIAAGNCAVLKPSEDAPATSTALAALVAETFAPEYVSVVEGVGAEVTPALIEGQRFDHIFFTGSTAVGKKIMAMAAGQLTPVTLELGGKSPAVVLADADLNVTAQRLAWGKFYNAGQSCVAPDYALVAERVMEPLIAKLTEMTARFYGPRPLESPDLGRIVNARRLAALERYLEQGRVRQGGRVDGGRLRMEPTLLDQIRDGAPVMHEEIFGPILPLIPFAEPTDALKQIAGLPAPLAAYVFTRRVAEGERFLSQFAFGGGCINDTLVHFANGALPFGGVGTSGVGRYHGRYSFETFSQHSSTVITPGWGLPWRYPPVGGARMRAVAKLLRR